MFEAFADEIRTFLFRRSGSWTIADDLTSVVFLEAWRRKEASIFDGSSRAWLYGIAINVLRNERRSRRRYRAALTRLSVERDIPDFSDDVQQRLDDEAQMRSLLPQLAGLRPDERDVLSLCVWSGLTYDEAAAALALPIGTVRSRLARAKARLREPESAQRTST